MKKFIECTLPVRTCNLRCEYCYVTQNIWWDAKKPELDNCIKHIGEALSEKRMGGICMVNICAQGETLLYPEIIDIVKRILECGHFIMLVSNAILTERINQFANFPKEMKSRLFFKCSFHYLELMKQNKLETFFSNINIMKKAGLSFTVEITPDDSYIHYIPEIKRVCMENVGALCHVTVPRDERLEGFPLMTKLPRSEFVETWKGFDSDLFSFKESIFEVKRKEFCYAGQWGLVLNLVTGEYKQCYRGKVLGNIYDEMDKPLKMYPIGHNCPEGHCFNGHAFLGFGLIPELQTVTFATMRNRKLEDGSMWLSKEMEDFMCCKLSDTNEELNLVKKKLADIKSFQYKKKWKK